MATTATDLKQIQRDIAQLKRQVARLERRGNGKRRVTEHTRETAIPQARRGEMSERERARAILSRAGVTRTPTPEEKKLAAEWDALSAAEKQEVEDVLSEVQINPPLSQLIHDMRR